MRKVLKRRLYDTNKAQEIASRAAGTPGDKGYITETLLKARKGSWFTVGSGGPMSSYGEIMPDGNLKERSNVFTELSDEQACDLNSWRECAKSAVFTELSDEQACDWLEEHGTAEKAMDHFGSWIEEA